MINIHLLFCFILLLISLHSEAASTEPRSSDDDVYIVYMGASVASNGGPRDDHTQLLNLMKRNKNTVVESYSYGFSGFAARLSKDEAESLARRPGVVSVFQDTVLQLHTTRSWDFLKYQNAIKIDSPPSFPADSAGTAADSIIGILDTGIWPESQSFNDEGIGPVPPRWKGKCMEGRNFNKSNCNRKLIGARYYDSLESDTPRDEIGHGTHVASTAAGMPVPEASYYDLAKGSAHGGSYGSRIAIYQVCDAGGGCTSSSILKGFDDAIADGVDVISLSLGPEPGVPNFNTDPVAIGAFHAVEKGIMVVCSAGNSGPTAQTIVNVAPWILTVAATTIDRDLQSTIVLSGSKIIQGGGIHFSKLDKTPVYPLIDGNSAKLPSTPSDNARNCVPGALDETKLKGKIILCENNDEVFEPTSKFNALHNAAVGMVIIDDRLRQTPQRCGYSPIAAVTGKDGAEIQSYINTTRNPMATILPTVTIADYKPAPVVAWFSSRGPIPQISNLLKPDVAAPGVSILAAWPSDQSDLPDKEPPLFSILSGTSMACPHVSGLAANIKSQHPTWSPSAIKSAILTTAIQKKSDSHTPITTLDGRVASPYDIGAGEISLSEPQNPGLIYETETSWYIEFLCNLGYEADKIKLISRTVADNFSCPVGASSDFISQMNYPSVAISNMKENDTYTVMRKVTNVGEDDSTYTAAVEAPEGVQVTVNPSTLKFTKESKTQSFQLKFTLKMTREEYLFGWITWSDAKYRVRSPFVVNTATAN